MDSAHMPHGGRGNSRDCGVSLLGGQGAFNIIELVTVLALLGLVLTIGVIAYTATRGTDVQASAEMVKEDIRKVYALSDSGQRDPNAPDDSADKRYRYKIVFHGGNDPYPQNAYKVMRLEYDEGASEWGWHDVSADRFAANKVIDDVWIKPSSSSEVQISYNDPEIEFIPKGSIIMTDSDPVGEKTVTVSTASGDRSIEITVSQYGSVSSSR